ncbi:MAG: hypothetical protein CL878_07730 [Dehalococcoidia bacterium]|nr:hypothetical protein [Dehalococcoidia bacterium]
MPLSSEQVWLFRVCGYVRLPGSLPAALVADLRAAIQHDIDHAVEPLSRNHNGKIVRISNILDRAPIFQELARHAFILDPLEQLLGPNIEVLRNRHNHATIRLAERRDLPLHRDVSQWSRPIASVIVFLEESRCENGATQLVPGTHLLPWVPNVEEAARQMGLRDQVVRVEMAAGGVLVAHSLVFHTIGLNRTTGTRTSITLGYHSADELAAVADHQRLLVRGERVYVGHKY